MSNPTPQQRIEELVREFTDSIIENYPPRHRDELGRDMLTYDLQHIATQAYMAGMEAVEKHCPSCATEPGFAGGRDCPGIDISQLKEQIK